jgi:hypothetical protein
VDPVAPQQRAGVGVHDLADPTPGRIERPSPDAVIQMIEAFFVKTLDT